MHNQKMADCGMAMDRWSFIFISLLSCQTWCVLDGPAAAAGRPEDLTFCLETVGKELT